MRRQLKNPNSPILENAWKYSSNSSSENSKIGETLLSEQNRICAYTETYLGGRFDSKDVEHFDPTLKDTPNDGYENWFLVNHKLNMEKGGIERWNKHQPILHPTAPDFEQRVIYKDGSYIYRPNDDRAKHLVQLLKLDDFNFVQERKLYIENSKKSLKRSGLTPNEYFQDLVVNEPERVKHIRAVEEEFGIKLFQ